MELDNEYWQRRREERQKLAKRGISRIWALSPSHTEVERIYLEQELGEKKEEKKSKEKSEHKKKKSSKEKEKKDDRKREKKRKRKRSKSDEEDEWVELTKELREEEAERTKQEEALIIGPQIPEHLLKSNSPIFDGKLDSQDRKNMLKGEAAAMAAYAAQGKRIPRRGEIGLSSGEISEFEKVGYVMSGTRHKSMEATRMRKEDQILTAEEKRLLSNFSLDERRNREETVLNQFRELIASKKSKN